MTAITLPDILFQAALGFVVTAGFAVLFNVPRSALPYSALIGAGGHALLFFLRGLGLSAEGATFCGSFAVGLVGFGVARRMHAPRMIFTVTGIISMVPGIPAYEMIIYFVHSDTLNGLQSAVRTGLITGAIAAGLSIARLLTEATN